jgi:hypothetical protein
MGREGGGGVQNLYGNDKKVNEKKKKNTPKTPKTAQKV